MSAHAGFDIAKEFHWLTVIDDRARLLLHHRVDNDSAAITEAIEEFNAVEAEHGPVTVGLDVLGGISGLLAAMLLAQGFRCVHVPGLAVNRARRGTRGGENKSDPRDAKVIAEQVLLRDDLRVVELPEETTVELRLLVSHRTNLVKDTTMRINRLRDLLTAIHPGLDRVVEPRHKGSLLLLSRYVTPAEIRQAGTARITSYLTRRGVKNTTAQALAEAAVTAARSQQLAVTGERRTAALIREFADELLLLRSRLKALENEIGQLVEAHPDGALIRSLPGMGATLTAEFLAAIGSIRRFAGGDALAAASGLAPVLTQSGKTRYSRSATGGDKTLKRVFYQSAFCAIKNDPASRTYYDRKRAEGKRHTTRL
ncbi:IS110 family transposase [Streptomyces sp. Je 1-4]|uniref:IS110 family transposase n=1 Tax=Streptomyces TaxID=1883 RepID=UPI0021DABA02|nr:MULTISPECIES: IS110 family transposase [unclassified Streptomyces]UYB43896.1 IS110 family transposase [Streptomyces sp. Je 1-4]UZQ40317.1 IS110 family transposase [Streptomyces sp. Je 1-4] [Streptomyces sp. Je 1-4 4N24]UZQ47734.1 IS110 family transposase [Streptomyces sp. Je 1-4] [Streptomyces sp. Je 1-4 4N24_ara]